MRVPRIGIPVPLPPARKEPVRGVHPMVRSRPGRNEKRAHALPAAAAAAATADECGATRTKAAAKEPKSSSSEDAEAAGDHGPAATRRRGMIHCLCWWVWRVGFIGKAKQRRSSLKLLEPQKGNGRPN